MAFGVIVAQLEFQFHQITERNCNHKPSQATRLILHCAFAASLWRSLGVVIPADFSVHDLRKLPRPATIEAVHYETFTLICCWQLWKRRNSIVFRQETTTLRQTLQACKAEARAWCCRLPRDARCIGDHWCSIFSLAM